MSAYTILARDNKRDENLPNVVIEADSLEQARKLAEQRAQEYNQVFQDFGVGVVITDIREATEEDMADQLMFELSMLLG